MQDLRSSHYADTGTQFGKFLLPAAAFTTEEKPTGAGDFKPGTNPAQGAAPARQNGARIGSVDLNRTITKAAFGQIAARKARGEAAVVAAYA